MDAKLKTGTCLRCKSRKIRCDGQDPCYSCSVAESNCNYGDHARESRFGFELRKGQACLGCRRKKKVSFSRLFSGPWPSIRPTMLRCDGGQPCGTCAFGRKEVPCEYPGGTIATSSPLGLDRRMTLPDIGSSGSSEGLVTPPEMWIFPHSVRTIPSELSVSTASSAEFSLPVEFFTPQGDVELPDIQSFGPFSFPDDILLPQPQLPSRHTTPPDPHFQVDPLIQDPQNEAEELSNMCVLCKSLVDRSLPIHASRSRKLFLTHRFQLGLSVPDSTLDAISQGASDHSVLHPALLHASQLMGTALLKNNVSNEQEAEQIHLTLGALQDPGPRAPRGPVASLQAVTFLSLYFLHKGNIARARALVLTGNTLVREHSLDTMGSLSESTTPVEPGRVGFLVSPTVQAETQAAVAQLVYLDASYAIMLKLPRLVDPLLRTNFRTLMGRPANEEINFVRAKSASLLYESQQLAVEWYQQSTLADTEVAEWQRKYWDVMEWLNTHRSFLALTLTKIVFCPKLHTMGLSLKLSTIIVLTGISVLLSLFSPDHPELLQKNHAAIAEIVSISSAFSEEDCEHLDRILSVCWTAILGKLEEWMLLGPYPGVGIHDIPAMAMIIRQKIETLERILPCAVNL